MASARSYRAWDQELAQTRARLEETRRSKERARRVLFETRLKSDRAARANQRVVSKAQEARANTAFAQRKAEEARHASDDARRKGLPPHRWKAELRRWESQSERSEQDARRWEDDARRTELDAKTLAEEERVWVAELSRLTEEVKEWSLRFQYQSSFGRGLTATATTASPGGSRSLAITQRATNALKEVLTQMRHRPDQALRLTGDPRNGITLALDTWSDTDHVITHGGSPVLIVDPTRLQKLGGMTLDISESSGVTQIIISH